MNPSPYPASFTSAHTRANIVKILLIAGAIVSGISLLTDALSLAVPPLTEDQEVADNPLAFAIVIIMLTLALLNVLVYIATVVFFLLWLYRAHDNLPAFGYSRRSLSYTPGWAVGSFFIPFVNLIVPYRAVKETWQKSVPLEEVLISAPSPPASFPIWWLFWLLASFSGNVSFRVSFDESVPLSTATIVSIVASALSILAAVMAYMVVDAIDKRQEEASRNLQLGTFVGPPPSPPSPVNMPMPDMAARQ